MDPVVRWKTITTIAVAFSAGNLFATACRDSAKAAPPSDAAGPADDGTTTMGTTDDGGDGSPTPPPEVTEADLAEVADAVAALADTVGGLSTAVADLTASLDSLSASVDALNAAAGETETRFEQHRCLLNYLRDADQDGEESEDNSDVDEYEIVTAMALCGFE